MAADGASVVIDLTSGTPTILHWGSELGQNLNLEQLRISQIEPVPHAHLDEFIPAGIWRENARGFQGKPALLGDRSGQDWSQLFEIVEVETSQGNLLVRSRDSLAKLDVWVNFELNAQGVLRVSQGVQNLGETAFALGELTTWLPLPDSVNEILDFTGRWVKERQPQRQAIRVGTWAREIREGRSGHDYSIVQLALSSKADYQSGCVYGVGLEWSGNTRHLVEQLNTGRKAIGAGELLLPGEVYLAPGESYVGPTVAAVYSDRGIDGVSDRFHRWLRSRPNHPTANRPRPLTLNVWEAVYFDHNLEKLTQLADVAKEIGVERFVLDDGWFGSRRDDKSGLGDWVVASEVWPAGLGPLIQAVNERGMEFGLWFEGEMVNPDSDLYRAHPDWILQVEGRVPPEGRNQQVLDLTNEGAFEHVLTQVDAILSEYNIAYIKWDHNRVLIEAAHNGQAAVRRQTQAIYRLFSELKSRHPGLEIESCSSGGGRIDLGMVNYADRFWTSDCNDALERQYIQRYTQFAIPPEMLGSHIGPTKSHTTNRVHALSFRAVTALFGHAGLEWDITECTAEELQALRSWAQYYKLNRGLLHGGKVVRVEQPSEDSFVHGVVAHDKSKAIFAYVQLRAVAGQAPQALRFAGLEPEAIYVAKVVEPAGKAISISRKLPEWLEGVELTGLALEQVGVRPPILVPESAVLIELERK